ncbi:MAG: superoxide dismutase [Alphaproteobacteria bacterium]
MNHTLPPLPYEQNALEPYISGRTLSFHYGKHHQAYVTNLNNLIANTPFAGKSLEDTIKESAKFDSTAGIFNNAAQVWNHTFFWNSMKPQGGDEPQGEVRSILEKAFGSVDEFKKQFKQAALGQFGSGWAWLVLDQGALKITKTGNADTPLVHEQTPLLTCDVWEHSYYLDYQNVRADYVDVFLNHLVNWDFIAENLAKK